LGEVLKDELILVFMSRNPTIFVLEFEDVVLAFPEISDSRGMPFSRSFQSSNTSLNVDTKTSFVPREGAGFLSHIQLKNDIEGNNKLKLTVREDALAPRSQTLHPRFQLVVYDMKCLSVCGRRRPCLLNLIFESRHFSPEGFEVEDGWFPRATLIGEKERAMVREG
jgi:hypothetical protein